MFTSPRFPGLRPVFVTLLVAVSLVAAACSDSASSSDEVPDLADVPAAEAASGHGEMAPDFTVMTLDGEGFTLSDHLDNDGRPVFLNMWASWCPPCRSEMPDINAASESHDDVRFIGVAVNDVPADSAEFAASIDIGYTIGFDEDGSVSQAYRVPGLPASYVISSGGIILERIFGSVTEAEIDALLDKWLG